MTVDEASVTGLDPLQSEDLRIEPNLDASGALHCVWTGKSSQRYPARVLGPWFEALLGVADAQGKAPVKMYFDQLTHFNSSTIGAIVQLIQRSRARGIPLTLVYSGAERWQRVSFEALRVFDQGDGTFSLEAA